MMSEDHKAKTLEMIAVMQAYVDGKQIEARTKGTNWKAWPSPNWAWESCEYRIATIPDSINWDHVSPEWKYMARDGNGSAFLYNEKPRIREVNSDWGISEGTCIDAEAFSSLIKGTGDWKDSLVKRP